MSDFFTLRWLMQNVSRKDSKWNSCARLIERGKTDRMQKKLDIFFANDSLTEE